MRKLASVQTISAIAPIEGKDRIVLATVEGWHVIVRKDEYNVGDQCVYVEIDSVLPEREEFEFLRSKNFHIKTMRMAGVVSEGICFPMSILPYGDYQTGQDVTSILGVTQYMPTQDDPVPAPTPRKHKYPKWLMRFAWFRKLVLPKKLSVEFPSFLKKTDETRIQNIPEVLNERNKEWVLSEKLDGTSASFALYRHKRRFLPDKFEFFVCSRNTRRPVPDDSVYWEMAIKYDMENVLRQIIGGHEWVAIQGECLGPKIQGNKYGFKHNDMYVFNVVFPRYREDSPNAAALCESMDLNFVPLLGIYTLPPTVDEVLKMAHGKSRLADINREGLVIRSLDGRDSFKAVDPLFLLEHDE